MRRTIHVMPVALAFVLGVHAVPAQDAAVGLSASVEGDALEIEVRAAPGTRVVAAVATRLAADGATLAIDDPLFIAASIQPELRGTTGADGAFRTSIPLDPVFRETVAALFIQAARLDPTGSAVSAPSAVVRVPIAAPRGGMAGAAAWIAAAVAALAILVVVPAGIRRGAAGLLAAGVLVATPLLLARAFWTERTTTPFLPYGGQVLAPLEEHFGREAAAGLVELNRALPPDQAVVFVAFPIPLGSDLLLHRLFAKRPFAVLPDLRFLPEWRARNAPRPVVVTIGEQRSPDGAEVVATRGAMSAWRPRT